MTPLVTTRKRKRGERGPSRPALVRNMELLNKSIRSTLVDGVPLIDKRGSPVIGEDGKPAHRSLSVHELAAAAVALKNLSIAAKHGPSKASIHEEVRRRLTLASSDASGAAHARPSPPASTTPGSAGW